MAEIKRKKKKFKIGGFLRFLQHVLITVAVVAVLTVISGSTVKVRDIYGDEYYTYTLWNVDQSKKYEESELFCSLFEREVSDIIRFGVIRSQMETDGKFDGKKIIDVTAYNNRTEPMPERYVTAEYYLEDLLKWENHGFEFSSHNVDSRDSDDFLNEYTIITVLGNSSYYVNSSDYYYMKTPEGIYASGVSGNSLPQDNKTNNNAQSPNMNAETTDESLKSDNEYFYFDVLLNRYKTVEGKNIEDYASEPETYLALCDNVTKAIQDLAYNYDEYVAYGKYYNLYNSNMRYCIEKTVGNHTEYFTNMIDDSVDGTQTDEVDKAAFFDEVFSGKMNGKVVRYLYYSPDEMIYESNSNINEEKISAILKQYGYAYPENVKIWIGVDSSYPAGDAIADGYKGYKDYVPNIWKYMGVAALAMVLYLALFLYMTGKSGNEVDENGNVSVRLTAFDRIPTGAALILGAFTAFVIVMAVYLLADCILSFEIIRSMWFKVCVGIAVFVVDMIFLFFYYSLVRRIKSNTLWKNSFLRRIWKKSSGIVLELYYNSGIVARTWVPYLLFIAFNLMMAILIILSASSGLLVIPIISLTVIADIAVGMILFRDVKERQNILNCIKKIAAGDFSYKVGGEKQHGYNTELAESVNSIGDGIKNAVENSMKDERMKTELITNVSHDIKTPLTSIINYVDLIKREEIDNEKVRSYIEILDEKSQRLKQLTDDLVEASKISSGNINLCFEKINLIELLNQTIGEFSEKFEQRNLNAVMDIKASNAVIEADSRRIWRIMENLFNNIYKYAMEGTRVYISVKPVQGRDDVNRAWIEMSLKNISATELNCNPEELTERFIRGDESRTTEGSGLGLSIAKNLTEAQNGTFEIQLDGDLFKVILTFPLITN